VIGINTAATFSFRFESGGSDGFAIPINRAVAIARQIKAGRSSSTVHVGPTAFLGVSLRQAGDSPGSTAGALVTGVLPGSAAEKAGIVPGDVITSFNGRAVSSPTDLATMVLRVLPGQKARLGWVDRLGDRHVATVRPAAGPPQ
jgi:S1-C subfamily serine protease